MHWIVQNNLYSEAGYAALMEILERHQIPHTVVKVVPFSHELIPEIDPKGLVYVCGSTTLTKVAHERGWTPGSFINENFHYSRWRENMGDYLLNPHATVGKFGDIKPPKTYFSGGPPAVFFVRPCEDNKTFSGMVMSVDEFEDWRQKVLDLKETYTTLDANTEIVIAPLKEIHQEFRFFVVDGKIITGSMYKLGGRVVYRDDVEMPLSYTQRMVDRWQPARAFVIDIAVTNSGHNVIEYNNINSAGFYASDVSKLVQAIEAMEF